MAIVWELWGPWQQIIYIGQVLKLAMLWKLLQKILEVFIWLKVIRPGRFGNAVYNGTGLGTTNSINSVPVFLPEAEVRIPRSALLLSIGI